MELKHSRDSEEYRAAEEEYALVTKTTNEEAAAAFRPDVIFLDIGMPKLNGYDACRRIRQQPWGKTVVMVACTGWGQEQDKQRSQEAGFNLHMVKPVDPATLENLLAGLQETTG